MLCLDELLQHESKAQENRNGNNMYMPDSRLPPGSQAGFLLLPILLETLCQGQGSNSVMRKSLPIWPLACLATALTKAQTGGDAIGVRSRVTTCPLLRK